MSDIALQWEPEIGAADVAVEANDLTHEDGLRTAVLLSLFLRRGEWWGDAFADVEGDQVGSRLEELLARAKRTPDLPTKTEEAAREALAWLVQDGVASRVDVKASFPRDGMWGLEVVIYRPQSDSVRFRFARAWAAEAGEPPPARHGGVSWTHSITPSGPPPSDMLGDGGLY